MRHGRVQAARHVRVLETHARHRQAAGAGQHGFARLTKVADLPPKKQFAALVKKATALNDAGVTIERKPTARKTPLTVPPELSAALAKNSKARSAFEAFSLTEV